LTGRCGHGYENMHTELSKLMVDYQEPPNELDIESHQSPNASKFKFLCGVQRCSSNNLCIIVLVFFSCLSFVSVKEQNLHL
jgi:hypothetical protein